MYGLLAAGDAPQLRIRLAGHTARWGITIAALVVLVVVAVGVYRLDTRGLGTRWRVLFDSIAVGSHTAPFVIAFNPQERIRQMAFRPSRVAILADTSLSMRFPDKAVGAPFLQGPSETAPRPFAFSGRFTASCGAAKAAHVAIYTFDAGLASPPAVVLPARANGPRRAADGAGNCIARGVSTGCKQNGKVAATAANPPLDWNDPSAARPRDAAG